jgi:hypothetical protein
MTAILISCFLMLALSFGCGGAGGDPAFSPDPSVLDVPGDDADGSGEGGEIEVPEEGDDASADAAAGANCFEDGFCNQRCASASECPPGFSCVLNMCTFDCLSDAECGSGGWCNDAGLCESTVAAPMPDCASDAACGSGRYCNAAQACEKIPVFLGCRNDADCPLGQYCDDAHSCALFPGAGVECAADGDCPGNYHCSAALRCEQECRADAQCSDGTACSSEGLCVAVGSPVRVVSFSFNTAGSQDASVFKSAHFRVDQVEIAPAGRSEMLSSAHYRLIGSTGF